MMPTEFPIAERLLRFFAWMVWAGIALLVLAVVVGVVARGATQAVLLGTLLSGALFFIVVGLALRAHGQRSLARLRGAGHPGDGDA
jgi:hypothetical protein